MWTLAAPRLGAMQGVEPILGILGAATVLLMIMAVLLAAALLGHGPLYGRFVESERQAGNPTGGDTPKGAQRVPLTAVPLQSGVRLQARERVPGARADALARRGLRQSEDEMDEVLRGTFAIDTFNRAVRVVAWSFILVVLLIVAVSQIWQPVEPEIFATLILAGIFVLVVHERRLRAPLFPLDLLVLRPVAAANATSPTGVTSASCIAQNVPTLASVLPFCPTVRVV